MAECGGFAAVYLDIAMSRTQAKAAGTIFALTMALLNIGLAVEGGFFTSLTDNIGFASVFRLQAGLSLILILMLWLCGARKRSKKETGSRG